MMSVSGNDAVLDTGTMEDLLSQISEKLDIMIQPEEPEHETVSDNTIALLEAQVKLQDTQIRQQFICFMLVLVALGIVIGILLIRSIRT